MRLASAVLASAVLGMAYATPVQAHSSDWGLPLVGGAVGGYALSSLMHGSKSSSSSSKKQPQAVAQPPVSTMPTVEERLHELDQLAAQGVITKQEYSQRRQAIINSL